jgi:hypothetical protein
MVVDSMWLTSEEAPLVLACTPYLEFVAPRYIVSYTEEDLQA